MSDSTIDVLIRGARVIDGSGNPWFHGDVAIGGEHVLDVTPAGRIPPENAGEVVDASGMVVCPGFIDIQSHSIQPLMMDGRCLSKITQGVTTEVMGESRTPVPRTEQIAADTLRFLEEDEMGEWVERVNSWRGFRDWFEAMIDHGVSPNIGSYLGGGTLRLCAKGMAMGRASDDELDLMRTLTREAMEQGAFGVSTALIYPPDAFIATDEIVEVCKVVAEYGGSYITHIRSEADRFLEGLGEAIDIGSQAGVPVEIYHLKASGRRNWHKMAQAIAMIDEARAAGLDVTADMYPYIAGGTGLASVLPPWAAADGKLFENLRDREMRETIRQAALNPSGDWEALADLATPEGVMPVGFGKPENQQYCGRRLSEIAEMRGQDWLDAAIDLLVAEETIIGTVYFMMSEDNLTLQLKQPWIKISTDAGGVDPAWAAKYGPTHPRSYGAYPRVLGKYVREEGAITLEDAIREMSSSVAHRLGLYDRGLLQPGCYADVVVFDPETIGDRATFENSHQLSTGIRDVWVNGTRVLSGGEHTGATPGQIVNGPGYR